MRKPKLSCSIPIVTVLVWLCGCQNPDDGPKPHVFTAYPVNNLRPASAREQEPEMPKQPTNGSGSRSPANKVKPKLVPPPRAMTVPSEQAPPVLPPIPTPALPGSSEQ